jgi:glycosyltransferase involved in cell wall biosynthesis
VVIPVVEPTDIAASLAQRLGAVSDVLLDGPSAPGDCPPAYAASILLDRLVRAVQDDLSPDRLWLLCTATFGGYPTADDVAAGIRFFELAPPIEATLWLLDRAAGRGLSGWTRAELDVVTDRVVVDVHYSARYELHTGMQQVTRRTVPIWERRHAVLPVAWTDDADIWRRLSDLERSRVNRRGELPAEDDDRAVPSRVIVPWHTVVVLIETPPREVCGRLAALAEHSGNSVVAVGHDCIPVVNADLVPAVEPQRFAAYLTVLKHARRIAGVSQSAAAEFGGFASALAAQGLPGPTVVGCLEAADFGAPAGSATPVPARHPTRTPLVVCVGSLEPRKNHLALLYAAERLWREHLDFELRLIAGSGWGDEVPAKVKQLQDLGRPIAIQREVTDAELASAYRAARFTVLVSLHEGYGLPVAESLAFGTPVITTNYGSTQEIAESGGALLVDPRDDEAIVDAMRRLLTDDHLLQSLQEEIGVRPARSWDHYATELWECLVRPELANTGGDAAP